MTKLFDLYIQNTIDAGNTLVASNVIEEDAIKIINATATKDNYGLCRTWQMQDGRHFDCGNITYLLVEQVHHTC